jgi:hypothetical protein
MGQKDRRMNTGGPKQKRKNRNKNREGFLGC